jgi:hypothetical protein
VTFYQSFTYFFEPQIVNEIIFIVTPRIVHIEHTESEYNCFS